MRTTSLRVLLLFAYCTGACLSTPAATLYVWQGSPSPAPPFTGWATAAHTIQDAVDAAQPGDTVLATNGVYATGGKAVVGLMTNRVAVDKRLSLQSVNGPEVTLIQGWQVPGSVNSYGAIRCVYLTNGASLTGFTLTNGATRDGGDHRYEEGGGGVWCESADAIVTNCVLTGNSAYASGGGAFSGTLNNCTLTGNSAKAESSDGGGASSSTFNKCILSGNTAYHGGGVSYGTLNNCTLVGNSAYQYGGGIAGGTLNNCTLMDNSASDGGGAYAATLNTCTLSGNSAFWGSGSYAGTLNNSTLSGNSAYYSGGGAFGGTLNNCIVYFNLAIDGANYATVQWAPIVLHYCCTTPMPADGLGNVTNAPLFVDLAGGSLRLQPNSPCINAGNTSYVTVTTDLDGNPRIVSGAVDIGAYEYQGTGSTISYAWLQQYGLPSDGSADLTDPDQDGQDTWQEWMADTDPTNAASCLRLTIPSNTMPAAVTFSSSAARLYTLLCCSNLTPGSVWTPVPGQTDMPGNGAVLSLTDTNPPAPAFYRVSVKFP